MAYISFRQSLFNRIWECPMPPVECRAEITNLLLKYRKLVESIANMKTVDIITAKSIVDDCNHIQKTLDDTFKRLVNKGLIGHTLCSLIEIGEYGFIQCWLDYEPEHFDKDEDEDKESPCEICGKDRKDFTENLCEECFDNETDKFYDGGLDE